MTSTLATLLRPGCLSLRSRAFKFFGFLWLGFFGSLAATASLVPVSTTEALDESTLREQILSRKEISHPDFPGRRLERLKVRFFSHRWKDGDWFGTTRILVPDRLDPRHAGWIFIAPTASSNPMPDLEMERDHHAWVALTFGIPVATVPQSGKHFGLSEIHKLSDHLSGRFLDTGDPSWLALYPFAALHMRAATLVGKIVGIPTKRTIQMGSSITAHQLWKTAACDPRLAGMIITGDMGLYEKTRTGGARKSRKITPQRPVMARLDQAPAEVKAQLIRHVDKAVHARDVQAPLLWIVGSNDFATSLPHISEFLGRFRMEKHLVFSPEYGHGCASWHHVRSVRMWIDHLLNGRPLTRLETPQIVWNERTLRIRVRARSEAELLGIRLYLCQAKDLHYFDSVWSVEGRWNGYRQARWESKFLEKRGDHWEAQIDLTPGRGPNLGLFLVANDRAGKSDGHTSLPMQWIHLDRR